MVCLRCKMVVESVLQNMGVYITTVELGEVQTRDELSQKQLNQLNISLLKFGLELMEDKKSMFVEKVKNIIVEMIHYSDELPETNFSDYLSEKLNYDYNYISNH